LSGAGRAFLLVWLLTFCAVFVLAWRQLREMMKHADSVSPEARELHARATRWAWRYSLSIMGLGAVMALAAPYL